MKTRKGYLADVNLLHNLLGGSVFVEQVGDVLMPVAHLHKQLVLVL